MRAGSRVRTSRLRKGWKGCTCSSILRCAYSVLLISLSNYFGARGVSYSEVFFVEMNGVSKKYDKTGCVADMNRHDN